MPPWLNALYAYFGKVKACTLVVSGAALLGMMLFIVADVIGRNVFRNSIPGNYEIVQNYFMPLTVFPALVYVYVSGVLPRITFFIGRLTPRTQKWVVIVTIVVELILMALVAWFGFQYGLYGMTEKLSFLAGGDLYILYPFIFLVPLGVGLVLIELLFLLARNVVSDKPTLFVDE